MFQNKINGEADKSPTDEQAMIDKSLFQAQLHYEAVFARSLVVFIVAHIIDIQHGIGEETHCRGGHQDAEIQCFCGQISEKHVFSSCALSLSFNSIHSLSCQILFSTCNVATFVSIFLHGAGFSVSHCKTASPPCCHKNVVPNFLQKIENFFFLLYFLNPLAVCSIGNME